MNPLLILAGLQAGGSLIGGISAKSSADLNAYNIDTERTVSEAQAKERARLRIEEFESGLSSNIAAIAKGRDISSSVSVAQFLERQKEVAASDLGAIQNDSFRRSLLSRAEASAERARGRSALVGSLFDAAGSMATGAYQTQQAKIDGTYKTWP